MSKIVPASFDPFATHPFTNGSGLMPKAPQPYPYPRPIPSAAQNNPQLYAQQPSSVPTMQTPAQFHAPQPMRPSSHQLASAKPQHVFEPFKLDRSSPDLQDVLAKKSHSKSSSPTTKSK